MDELARIRLSQADLTRVIFGSIEIELLLLEPGVQLTCWSEGSAEGAHQEIEGDLARRPGRALMVQVLQALLGGEARHGRPHVWWSDQI